MKAPLVRRWETVWNRMLAVRDRARLDDELREEMETHLAMRRDRLIADGMHPEAAEREARLRFGNLGTIAEDAADARGLPRLESILNDLVFGWRMVRRAPLFSIAAIASLAVAVAGATAVFAIADALLLRRLPVADPGSLVGLRWHSGNRAPFGSLSGWGSQDESGMESSSFSAVAYRGMREAVDRASLFGFADLYRVNALVEGAAELASGQVVSGNYARALGLVPALGRLLDDGDDRADAAPVVVLSHAYWQRRFAGDRDVLGRAVTVNGIAYAIVGVAPRGFHGTLQVEDRPELTFPLIHYGRLTGEDVDRATHWYVLLMARLRPGETAARLRPFLDTVLARTTSESKPELAAADLPRLALVDGSRGQLESRGDTHQGLRAMAAIVGLLLLVACANVASLQLARGEARGHEIATRLAIGASRPRIVRQLLTEGLLLAALAGAVGVGLAWLLGGSLLGALGRDASFAVDLSFGGRTLAFALLVTLVCAVAFALAPALRLTRRRPTSTVTAAATRSTRRQPLASVLVVAQVACTLVLVAIGAQLVASARGLAKVDPGFETERLLLADLEPARGETESDTPRRLPAIRELLSGLPDVEGVTFTSHRLLAGSSAIAVSTPPGASRPTPGSEEERAFERAHLTRVLAVGDTFFSTFGLPVVRGRALDAGDDIAAPRVAVVNRRLAVQLYGSEEVVGRQLLLGEDATPHTIVGVAADARYASLRQDPPATLYASLRQRPAQRVTLAVRTRGEPLASAPAVRRVLRESEPALAVSAIGTQAEQARASMQRERLFAQLSTALGAATLLLSATGLFGLLGYSVAQRTREIGVRMAIGARRREVAGQVVRQALRLVGLGVGLGLPAALATGRLVESLLYGLAPGDLRALGVAAALLLTVGALAALLPARRAAGVDPLVALRAE